MVMTREELQAEIDADAETTAEQGENVTEETAETETTQESDEAKTDVTTDEEAEEAGEDGESETGEPEKAEVEDWLKGDDHKSQAEKKFTDGDIGKVKAKLKSKFEKQHSGEIEELQAKIAELESGFTVVSDKLKKPKREDFDESDDPDAAYDDALTDYVVSKSQATVEAAQVTNKQQRIQAEQALKISQGEDEHYERAAVLVKKSGISAESYQAADSNFKQVIEDVIPGAGDQIAAALVSKLGEGSEKVVYNIGVNRAKQAELKSLLQSDQSGLDAAIYLAGLRAELNSTTKRKTNAPVPAPEVKGNIVLSDVKKQLAKAETSGDIQKQIDLRRKIRIAGIK